MSIITWVLYVLFILIFTAHPTFAVDATDSATEIRKIGSWNIIEFAGAEQMIYRLTTDSIDGTPKHIVFDIAPSNDCTPTSAVLIMKFASYNPTFDEGAVPFAYKVSGQKEAMELTKSAMSEGDQFAFFSFEKLTVSLLRRSGDKGKLAVWIPPSGDGAVKRTSNIYFPLEGFSQASNKATRLCRESR
jgi:hypothetical protein